MIGVAGGSGSGKSSLTRALKQRHPDRITVVQHDAYYRPLTEAQRRAVEAHNFDHPDALETDRLCRDLEALARGLSVRVPRYDFATHTRLPEEEWEQVCPAPWVLVEGILVLVDPNLRRCFDKGIFVDAEESVRVARRVERDGISRGREEGAVKAQLARTVLPMHRQYVDPSKAHADLIVDGTAPLEEGVVRLESLLGLVQETG